MRTASRRLVIPLVVVVAAFGATVFAGSHLTSWWEARAAGAPPSASPSAPPEHKVGKNVETANRCSLDHQFISLLKATPSADLGRTGFADRDELSAFVSRNQAGFGALAAQIKASITGEMAAVKQCFRAGAGQGKRSVKGTLRLQVESRPDGAVIRSVRLAKMETKPAAALARRCLAPFLARRPVAPALVPGAVAFPSYDGEVPWLVDFKP
jgi:hypothetical protein